MARQHEHRSVIITGSTSGIGLGIASAFAREGANITLNGFGEAAAIEAMRAAMAEEFGVKVRYSAADMSKPTQIATMVSEAAAAFGGCDMLVNNAGIQYVAPVDEFPIEKWDAIIAINLSSVFHATRAALPHMKSAKWGRVINIASAHGLVASPFKSAYVAAKHGVVGFTKSCALEVAEQGITVNAICPGYVFTPLVEKQIDDQAKVHGIPRENVIRDILLAPQPNKRFAEVNEVAALTVYLASDAAQGITGTAMSIDGGWTAR
ncbi:MAG: 3-hydroxybutyrate dehydrogenase [Betaproteobacteria bacterium]|jgi:3-hydroxybutyrate dehydrogenase